MKIQFGASLAARSACLCATALSGYRPWKPAPSWKHPCLTPLPERPFVPARWKTAWVHPDQFIQVKRHFYGVPASYIGKQIDVRIALTVVTIYYEHRIIRQYTVPNQRRHFLS